MNAQRFYSEGLSLKDMGYTEEAKDCFRQAMRSGSYDVELNVEIANRLNELKDHAGAMECLRRVLSFEPHNAKVWLRLSEIHEAIGDSSSAQSAMLSARRCDPYLFKSPFFASIIKAFRAVLESHMREHHH